jgi:prepilin-type N-terminal cleavage/methylation domain-containing protein
MSRDRQTAGDEQGFTLVELLIGSAVSLVVLGAILAMVQVAARSEDRLTEQVYANQRARPAMNRIVDRLHSACVSPGLAPVRPESTESKLILYSKSSSAVNPAPNRYVFELAGGKLTETTAVGTGTEPSNWSFGTASSPLRLLDGVTAAKVGEPPTSTPLFRYYAYEEGHVATSPLPVPLSAEDAARTVQVDIGFSVGPRSAGSAYSGVPIAVTDSATLRIEPASEDSAQVNLPCV